MLLGEAAGGGLARRGSRGVAAAGTERHRSRARGLCLDAFSQPRARPRFHRAHAATARTLRLLASGWGLAAAGSRHPGPHGGGPGRPLYRRRSLKLPAVAAGRLGPRRALCHGAASPGCQLAAGGFRQDGRRSLGRVQGIHSEGHDARPARASDRDPRRPCCRAAAPGACDAAKSRARSAAPAARGARPWRSLTRRAVAVLQGCISGSGRDAADPRSDSRPGRGGGRTGPPGCNRARTRRSSQGQGRRRCSGRARNRDRRRRTPRGRSRRPAFRVPSVPCSASAPPRSRLPRCARRRV